MAVLRIWKGSVLEENLARTAGSIGESVAAGAVFTIPAFVISGAWPQFDFEHTYWQSTAMILIGSILGVLFVSLVRRVLVEDDTLPFPESVAAAEIHKAGQRGADAARYLFWNIGVGALVQLMGEFKFFLTEYDFTLRIGTPGVSSVRLGAAGSQNVVAAGGVSTFGAPMVSPAYLGVGYVIGPRLAALQFSGALLAWGMLVPLFMFFLGPRVQEFIPAGAGDEGWASQAAAVWRYIVRPIAVGGMLVGAAYTLMRMGRKLTASLGRALSEVRHGAPPADTLARTERYMGAKTVFGLIGIMFIAMLSLYIYISGNVTAGSVAALVMLIVGFFFATVSGNLVGMIGSSNNPISGLTLSTLIIAALLMVALGMRGPEGVAVVLGVAAVVCVSAAVAGELLQDFKAGYILGGTPRTIQIVELIAVVLSSVVMWFILYLLYVDNRNQGGIGFGDAKLSAPQAGLMAILAQGIVGGDIAWPLVVTGAVFGLALILLGVASPMLVSVGMYLPFSTCFGIFFGGMVRGLADRISIRAGHNEAQRARVENVGILIASGFIAGEALTGVIVAGYRLRHPDEGLPALLSNPGYTAGFIVLLILSAIIIRLPFTKAGRPEDPAPPPVMM